jgi:hypothetical protein
MGNKQQLGGNTRTTTEANTLLSYPLVCDNKAIVFRINEMTMKTDLSKRNDGI